MSIRPLQESRPPPPVSVTATAAPSPSVPDVEPSPFARVLRSLGREVNEGEATVRLALHASHIGHDIGPQELLALQAGVYRYSEAVDLAAKLIDRASSGVKTVISGQ